MRIFIFTIIAVGLMFILPLMGIQAGFTSISKILQLKEDGTLTFSSFVDILFSNSDGILGTLGLFGAGVLILGLVISGQLENFIMLPFIVAVLFPIAGGFVSLFILFGQFEPWISIPMRGLIAAFIVGYILSLFEYFRGNI